MKEAKITIILLNYKRPQNIPIILETIKKQTIKANIFLWNNGKDNVNSPLIDYYYKADKNVGCMARWKLAKKATTPYVMSLDDDICFSRDTALQDIVKALEEQDNPNRIIGFAGIRLGIIPIYLGSREISCRYEKKQKPITKLLEKDAAVDIVKGRSMAFRKELLDKVKLIQEREDDIFLSAVFAEKKRRFHRISAILNDAFAELPEYEPGNWQKKTHFLSRNRAVQKYFF